MHAIKKNCLMLRSLSWSGLHGCSHNDVQCMKLVAWTKTKKKVICLIGEWENEDSIRPAKTHLCKIYLCCFEIVLVRLRACY